MRVTLIALGRGLPWAGHHLIRLASADLDRLAASHGLQLSDMGGRLETVARGRRVAALGVGPQPSPRSKLTGAGLARAIQPAGSDPALRRRAADLSAQIRAEDGVSRAVAAVEAAGRVSALRALG